MEAILERIQADIAIQTNATSSAHYSQSFSMKGYRRAAVILQVGTIPATGSVIEAQILGGDSTTVPASMSSITNATIAVGTSSTAGTVYNAHSVRITCNSDTATVCATGVAITVGTSTFLTDSTASSGGKTFGGANASHSSVLIKSLATMIQEYYPGYNTTYGNTGSTAAWCNVELTDIQATTTGLRITCTAQATISGFTVQSMKSQGMINFSAAQIMATASTFTNFCVRVVSTLSSAVPFAVTVLREPIMTPQQIGWGNKRDISDATLI